MKTIRSLFSPKTTTNPTYQKTQTHSMNTSQPKFWWAAIKAFFPYKNPMTAIANTLSRLARNVPTRPRTSKAAILALNALYL
ncbi:MAG: hypothetical protein COT21_00765, partial [Hadesarchaea archaeon CG08_land_8_20_14_0_20_51_8]